ncbi:PLC-like phosphodiesterase [Dunaliella salina]|uniref:glycerophosphodiester phosphodiesterase n=1 Tax=Dunaliella salina TaxID=3046 RepID=A0ABQ7GT07_DUNSA|nr:PLC-like phosphodiesterase [Dunaliella salina]|eukprot:KAF5837744.1 PLC-like phosphodiesterase [Dunaliella salina]
MSTFGGYKPHVEEGAPSQPRSRPNLVLLGWLGAATVILATVSHYAHASPHSGASMSSSIRAQEAQTRTKPWELPLSEPLVIAHRGASAAMPELAPEAYKLAIEEGADSIECDILLTKDLRGICRHNPELDLSTNVRDQFGDRTTTKTIDGQNITGVFASDLTLAEVKQLRLVQPLPFRDQQYNGRFQVATMEEFLQIALDAPRTVAVHLEVKHPQYHNSLPQVKAAKTSIEQIVLDAMKQRGFAGPINSPQWLRRPSYLLCFDGSWLKKVAKLGSCIPRLLLLKGNVNELSPDGRSIPDLTSPCVHFQGGGCVPIPQSKRQRRVGSPFQKAWS